MYVKVVNKDIEDFIKSEMLGDFEVGMLVIGIKKCWFCVNFIQFNLKILCGKIFCVWVFFV